MENVKLDDWFGKDVGVLFAPQEEGEEQKPRSGTLQSADERGVMLSYLDAKDLSPQVLFFPWHRIMWIRRLTK